jgi:NitT/TauT family transport system substrate-binding protein
MEKHTAMSIRHRSSIMLSLLSALLLVVLLTACGRQTETTGSNASTSTKPLKDISIGLGYNPDIQFAPFYLAKSKGYYQNAGLNVTFHHGIVPDLIGTMVAGKSTFVFASGDEMLVALDKNKGLKILDVATIYQKYPVSLIVPANSPIKTLADVKGHSIGEPGPFGSTHTGLLALLYDAHLAPSDVKIQSIGFNQVSALITHKVDAVIGYANNEPLQLENHGFKVRTFPVSNYQPLVSNGIITTQDIYSNQPQMVRDFVQATLKGLQDVIANPAAGVDASKDQVPGLNVAQATDVLKATIPLWQGKGPLGYNDSVVWDATEKFLVAQKMIAAQPNLTQFYTNKAVS